MFDGQVDGGPSAIFSVQLASRAAACSGISTTGNAKRRANLAGVRCLYHVKIVSKRFPPKWIEC